MRLSRKQLDKRVESFNSNLPAHFPYGLILHHHSGWYHLYKGLLSVDGKEILSESHLISGTAKEIDYVLDGMGFTLHQFSREKV